MLIIFGDGTTADAIYNVMKQTGAEVLHVLDTSSDWSAPMDTVVWIAIDVPVFDGVPNVAAILPSMHRVCARLPASTLVIISTQLPVGSIHEFEMHWPRLRFACIPENFRPVQGMNQFVDRIVVGFRDMRSKEQMDQLLPSIPRCWMNIESAELSKHALNAFLACEIAFINEIAVIADKCGADAADVAIALKLDARIGTKAYLTPGAPFSNGHLERELHYLIQLGVGPVIASILKSNNSRKGSEGAL
jgi:UDPglucose 6-dehydrogenase